MHRLYWIVLSLAHDSLSLFYEFVPNFYKRVYFDFLALSFSYLEYSLGYNRLYIFFLLVCYLVDRHFSNIMALFHLLAYI